MIDLSNKRSLYRIYKKKKPNGKFRVIYAPQGELKEAQKKLAAKLGVIYEPPSCVYAYVSGRSTRDLAECHLGKDWLITIDLKDFFPSIKKDMVLSLQGISEYEADLATYDGSCVQGSPCSPIISNMYMKDHDEAFLVLFARLGITYTRYSDDIQLSGFGRPSWQLINIIRQPLRHELKLELNEKKIKFMFKNQRQEVLGICVNDKLSVNRKLRSQLKFRASRGMLDQTDEGRLGYIRGIMK